MQRRGFRRPAHAAGSVHQNPAQASSIRNLDAICLVELPHRDPFGHALNVAAPACPWLSRIALSIDMVLLEYDLPQGACGMCGGFQVPIHHRRSQVNEEGVDARARHGIDRVHEPISDPLHGDQVAPHATE